MEDFGGLCCIKECNLPVLAVGMCNKHWRRNKRYGSPALVVRTAGYFIGKTASERFEMQVVRGEGCWGWRGSVDKDGYSIFKGEAAGQMFKRGHRWSWAFHNAGPIPDGMLLMHSCDNPVCSNPAHLTLGTQKDNQRDKWAKGRAGRHAPARKLTDEDVAAIRLATGFQREIAARYGVSQTTVSSIKARQTWTDVK